MRKRTASNNTAIDQRVYFSDSEVAAIIGTGLSLARKVANDAGAVRYVGNRRLVKLATVLEFIENQK